MAVDKYYKLQDDVIETFNEKLSALAFPTKINFIFLGDKSLKKLLSIKKVPDVYQYLYEKQVLVLINEPLYDKLSEDPKSIEVLFNDELDNLGVNMETGAIKIGKPTFVTNFSVAEKYTVDEVKRVKELEKLTLEQTKEKEMEQAVEPNGTY